MPPKKSDLTPLQQVTHLYLAYIAIYDAQVKRELAQHFNLVVETNAQHRVLLDFYFSVCSRARRAGLSYTLFSLVLDIVMTYFSTTLETPQLQHFTMSIISTLQRPHDGFVVEAYEQADDFGEQYAKGSLKEAQAAAEIVNAVALIGKPVYDPKKAPRLLGVVITEDYAASCAAICGYYLNKRELFNQVLHHTPHTIVGHHRVEPPCRSYCRDLCKLSEGFPHREVTKQELLIREAVIERASRMWEEIKEKVEAK